MPEKSSASAAIAAPLALSDSGPAPATAVARDERIRLERSPRAGLERRQRRRRPPPGFEDGLEQGPRLLDPVAARVQRRVAVDGIEQQSLVRLGWLTAEDLAVLEVERDRRELEIRPGFLRDDGERDALVGLDANGEQIWLDARGIAPEDHVRRAAESDGDLA